MGDARGGLRTGDFEDAILEMNIFAGISVKELAGETDASSKVRVYKDAGTLTVSPESQEISEYFEATREEMAKLPDGTEAELRYIELTIEGGMVPSGRVHLRSSGSWVAGIGDDLSTYFEADV